jgi:hypothetical protein
MGHRTQIRANLLFPNRLNFVLEPQMDFVERRSAGAERIGVAVKRRRAAEMAVEDA